MGSTYRTNPALEFDVERTGTGAATVASVGTDSLERHEITDVRVFPVLEHAFEPRTDEDLVAFAVEEAGFDRRAARETVEALVEDGLLLSDPQAVARREAWTSTEWNKSLLYNFASRDWEVRQSLDGDDGDERDGGASVSLPDPDPLPDRPLDDVLLSRRTCRKFDGTPTTRRELGSLLGNAFEPAGERSHDGSFDYFGDEGFPFGVYPVVVRATDLDPAVYRYRVDDHDLRTVGELPDDPEANDDRLQEIVMNQPYARDAAVVFLLTGDLAACQSQFRGEAAFRQLLTMVSGQAHRILLSATARGLNAFQSAALEDSTADDLVGVDGYDEAVLYFVAVGRKAEEEDG